MSNQVDENKPSTVEVLEEKKKPSNRLEFALVIVMLGVLTILLVIMVLKVSGNVTQEFIDYSKWIVTALLAAFGAWIGAGAAYFFGKSNLLESSRSTERALEIQRGYLNGQRGLKYIKDLNLTAMNTNFLFKLTDEAKKVADGLNKNVGYWFVPVINDPDGVLKDIIHAREFWGKSASTQTIQQVIDDMDKDPDLKKLHGEVFYSTVKLYDSIQGVYELMKAKNIAVAIVIDDKGKPTHCLSRTDLGSITQAKENE